MQEKNPLLTEFGKKVRKLRLKTGLSQERFAEKAGFDRTYISLIERGLRNPQLSSLCKLAKALEIDLKTLVSGMEKHFSE